jgi:hypothetical protein
LPCCCTFQAKKSPIPGTPVNRATSHERRPDWPVPNNKPNPLTGSILRV